MVDIKKVIVAGTNNTIYSLSELLDPGEMKLVGLSDTREELWNIFDEVGEVKANMTEMPIMPLEMIPAFEPDIVMISDTDDHIVNDIRYVIIRSGYENDIIFLKDLKEQFSISGASLRRLAHRINSLGMDGSIAELGAGKGDVSWQLNVLFPERKLFLFDTFEGFDKRDIDKEQVLELSKAEAGQQKHDDEDALLARLPDKDNVVIKKGRFPETALDLENEKFAFVYMDAKLYSPTKSGLEFFFPRMSQGGIIMLSGYNDEEYGGVSRAVSDMEEKFGAFLIVPIGDLDGTLVIVHP